MLVSCSYCQGLHKRGEKCKNKPMEKFRKKENNSIVRFRNTNKWKLKRDEIKRRDKFLCQVCLLDGKYTFQKLEVHHITPISEKWNIRLESWNLITVCSPCHKMAENGEIKRAVLHEMAKNADAFKRA